MNVADHEERDGCARGRGGAWRVTGPVSCAPTKGQRRYEGTCSAECTPGQGNHGAGSAPGAVGAWRVDLRVAVSGTYVLPAMNTLR